MLRNGSYIKRSPVYPYGLLAYTGDDNLIATIAPTDEHHDADKGAYRFGYGGACHGKGIYAIHDSDLNATVSEYVDQFHMEAAA